MFLTLILMLTVLVLTVEESAIGAKKAGASAAPVSIGLALFLAELVGVFYTGGCTLLLSSRIFSMQLIRTFPCPQLLTLPVPSDLTSSLESLTLITGSTG